MINKINMTYILKNIELFIKIFKEISLVSLYGFGFPIKQKLRVCEESYRKIICDGEKYLTF